MLNISLFYRVFSFRSTCLLRHLQKLLWKEQRLADASFIELSHRLLRRDRRNIKWKAFKARRTVASRIFIDSGQVYESLLYDFLHEFRRNNGWLARKGANRARFRNREACDWSLINNSRIYLRAKLHGFRAAQYIQC